jgi:hypothetical protein
MQFRLGCKTKGLSVPVIMWGNADNLWSPVSCECLHYSTTYVPTYTYAPNRGQRIQQVTTIESKYIHVITNRLSRFLKQKIFVLKNTTAYYVQRWRCSCMYIKKS